MAATDKELGALHKAVATALTGLVSVTEDEDGNTVAPPAAYLNAAIAFLKNNNITASVTTNEALAELDAALKRRATKRTADADLIAASEAFARQVGQDYPQ